VRTCRGLALPACLLSLSFVSWCQTVNPLSVQRHSIVPYRTSGQSNLTACHIAAAYRRFSRIRHVEPTCSPSSTSKSASHRNGAAPGRVVLTISLQDMFEHVFGRPLSPSKLSLHVIWIPSNPCFLGPTGLHAKTASRPVQSFSQGR